MYYWYGLLYFRIYETLSMQTHHALYRIHEVWSVYQETLGYSLSQNSYIAAFNQKYLDEIVWTGIIIKYLVYTLGYGFTYTNETGTSLN